MLSEEEQIRAMDELQGNPIWEHALWLLEETYYPVTLNKDELNERLRTFLQRVV